MSIFSILDKIIPSRRIRHLLINPILGMMSEEQIAKLMFLLKLGRLPDFQNPQRYTDKIALYKARYEDSRLGIVTDKYTVRQYIKDLGYGRYLNELYAVADKVEQLDFTALPSQFVIKGTQGDCKKEVLIVRDKDSFSIENIKKIVNSWNRKPHSKIIVEALLPNDAENHFYDYKFFCFKGKVDCLYVVSNYIDGSHDLSFYDKELEPLKVYRTDSNAGPINFELQKPDNWQEMLQLAEELSAPFPHCRVDLYNINGRVYFGELTFTTGGGCCKFVPDSFDFELGKKFDVSEFLNKQ